MRYLGVSSTILALLIALISVTQSALPVFLKAMKGHYTDLKLNLLSVEGTTATFLVTNGGSMPGRLGEVVVARERDDQAWPDFHIAYTRSQALINPGEMREESVRLNPDVSNECSVDAFGKGAVFPMLSGDITITMIGYDGKESYQGFPMGFLCDGSHWQLLPVKVPEKVSATEAGDIEQQQH